MGSGNSGNYPGTIGASQPFSDVYHVVGPAIKADKEDPDIYDPDTGYFKNPTAVKLEDAVNNNRIYVDGKKQCGRLTYVMDEEGNIIIGKRFNPNNPSKRSPHPTLIGGKDPIVQCAGMIEFDQGRILSVNTNSGHFKPNRESLTKVKDALQRMCDQNPEIFSPKSEWRNKR